MVGLPIIIYWFVSLPTLTPIAHKGILLIYTYCGKYHIAAFIYFRLRIFDHQFKITAERVFRERYWTTVSIRTRAIAAGPATPRRADLTERGMERDPHNVLLLKGDLQNAPKHGKGVVARQPSGALS